MIISKVDLTKKNEKDEATPLTWEEMDNNWKQIEDFSAEIIRYVDVNSSTSSSPIITPNQPTDYIYIESKPDTDQTEEIQNAFIEAYNTHKAIVFGPGEFTVTRSIYIFDGLHISGQGIYNTIFKTPFRKKSSYFKKGTEDYDKAVKAEQYCGINYYGKDLGTISGLNMNNTNKTVDLINGHNRFYLGDGTVGYYDGDRATNPDHPLYYPKPSSSATEELAKWNKWNEERLKIQRQGRCIGPTGRENYGEGLFKSSQKPGLKHELDKNSKAYSLERGTSIMHTGIRDVTIRDLCITTNSVDRGKDTCINFKYDASHLKGTYAEYDSSCLKIHLENVWMRDGGKNGYEVTRAVQHTFVNCSCWRLAEVGFYIDGVTSINFQSCYTNSCCITGYQIKGCNYSTLISCAADGCGVAYNIQGSHSIALVGCGAEATRYTVAYSLEEGTEQYQKGRSFSIRNSTDISLISPYSFAFRNRMDINSFYDTDDHTPDESFNTSRHVYVNSSSGVIIQNPYFKSALRVRTTPFRNAAGDKCNINMGTYDDTVAGSRTWQAQQFLMGASYEVEGDSKVSIISNKSEKELKQDNEIRCGNLDFYDPGTVANPLTSANTAGKTMSNRDGNGGWIITNMYGAPEPVTWYNFELLFPLNDTKNSGKRDKYWQWRNSLKLIKVYDDVKNGYVGYKSVLGEGTINWSNVTEAQFNRFTLDVLKDRTNSEKLDGDDSLYDYGTYMIDEVKYDQNLDPLYDQVTPAQINGIPSYTKAYTYGNRIEVNNLDSQTNKKYTINAGDTKAVMTIVSNAVNPTNNKYDKILQLCYPIKKSQIPSGTTAFGVMDSNYYQLGGFSADPDVNKILSYGDKGALISLLSRDNKVRAAIDSFNTSANYSTTALAKQINAIIKCLEGHNLINTSTTVVTPDASTSTPDTGEGTTDPEVTPTITLTETSRDDTNITLTITYENTGTVTQLGIVHSKTNSLPTYESSTRITSSVLTSGATLVVPIETLQGRYCRAYMNNRNSSGTSTRYYSTPTLSIT